MLLQPNFSLCDNKRLFYCILTAGDVAALDIKHFSVIHIEVTGGGRVAAV